jgi:prevent-host-death family protein
MNIAITDAKAQLTELVRRAENGETIVLTRHGRPTVMLQPVPGPKREWTPAELEERRRVLLEISERASKKALPGPDAAHAADFLYGDDGLPK